MWHVLALALGGRTIAEWRRVMTRNEFLAWCEFYRAHPFDDLHRFHRPAALISASMGGGEVDTRLDWLTLAPSREAEGMAAVGFSQADIETFRAAGMKPPPKRIKG